MTYDTTAEEARQNRLMILLGETKEAVIVAAMNEHDKTGPGFVRGVTGAYRVLHDGLSLGYEPVLGSRVQIEGAMLEGVQEGADALLTAFATVAIKEGLIS